jgi:Glucose-6-phosphate dehydrogenase subunit
MPQDVWSAENTTPDEIEAALRGLLRRAHAANELLAPARVLNLVVVIEAERKDAISERLSGVGRYHASRTVLCTVHEGRATLDATAAIHYEEPRNGIGVVLEQVEIEIGPRHLAHIETIVDPVVVSELPTVLWRPGGADGVVDRLLALTDVILLDSDEQADTPAALVRARELLGSAYVVDLAWLRTTPWRERVAASFDPPWRRPALERIAEVDVRHRETSQACALLWAGWMASRLGWAPAPLAKGPSGAGLAGGAARAAAEVGVKLDPVELRTLGLAGVTVACTDGFALSLDRSAGGLEAHRHSPDGEETSWKVLGASRGEGGILGEGVRQALLRDPTYGPALDAARGFCPA